MMNRRVGSVGPSLNSVKSSNKTQRTLGDPEHFSADHGSSPLRPHWQVAGLLKGLQVIEPYLFIYLALQQKGYEPSFHFSIPLL